MEADALDTVSTGIGSDFTSRRAPDLLDLFNESRRFRAKKSEHRMTKQTMTMMTTMMTAISSLFSIGSSLSVASPRTVAMAEAKKTTAASRCVQRTTNIVRSVEGTIN